ncbi:MAG: purine-nucleoside phosphorylase [Chloroherpetonaceae bacterium]|nr:purine-nucleoside phosphorylase [Chloroherpetonaceae bacterium]
MMKAESIDAHTEEEWESRAEEAAGFILRKIGAFRPRTAVVLGSGLGSFGERISPYASIEFSEIPHYPLPGVAGHQGKMIFGTVSEAGRENQVVLFKGRSHLYEGKHPEEVLFYLRLLSKLKTSNLILTNAAGGVNPEFEAGELCLITDFLNLQLPYLFRFGRKWQGTKKPLIPFDDALMKLAIKTALEKSIRLRTGVYAGLLGPSYETPAEIRTLGRMGADLVGMSTVLEATVAAERGLKVLGISLVTNKGAGLSLEKLSHEDVQHVAEAAKERFSSILFGILAAV